MRKISKEKAVKDKIWRDAVLAKEPSCRICDKSDGRLNAHHLIPREFAEFRWDVKNGMTLCVTHHTFGKFSAHKNPVWFTLWLINHRSETFQWIQQQITNLDLI